jgi:hypothetical protein
VTTKSCVEMSLYPDKRLEDSRDLRRDQNGFLDLAIRSDRMCKALLVVVVGYHQDVVVAKELP